MNIYKNSKRIKEITQFDTQNWYNEHQTSNTNRQLCCYRQNNHHNCRSGSLNIRHYRSRYAIFRTKFQNSKEESKQ